MAYALTWANYNSDSYWVPIPGEIGVRGVAKMHDDDHVAFADSARWEEIGSLTGYLKYTAATQKK